MSVFSPVEMGSSADNLTVGQARLQVEHLLHVAEALVNTQHWLRYHRAQEVSS